MIGALRKLDPWKVLYFLVFIVINGGIGGALGLAFGPWGILLGVLTGLASGTSAACGFKVIWPNHRVGTFYSMFTRD